MANSNSFTTRLWEVLLWSVAVAVALIGASGLIKHYGNVLNPNADRALQERINRQDLRIDQLYARTAELDTRVAANTASYGAMMQESLNEEKELRLMRQDLMMHDRAIISDFTKALRGETIENRRHK